MQLANRHYVSGSRYRFGFQGQEGDDEWNGEGNMLAFKYRIHDARLGRFLSVDPLADKYRSLTPYGFVGNNPLIYVDHEGKDIYIYDQKGHLGIILVTGDADLRYEISNELLSFVGDPVVLQMNALNQGFTKHFNGYGARYADAVGFAVDVTTSAPIGISTGFEIGTFTRGQEAGAFNFYLKLGAAVGGGGTAGTSLLAAWNNNLPDAELTANSWTGWFSSYWGGLQVDGIGASGAYFWSIEENKPDILPWVGGTKAWEGFMVGIPGTPSVAMGLGWSSTHYWHIGTIGGENNGGLQLVEPEKYELLNSKINKAVGILDVDKSEISSRPYEDCESQEETCND